MHSKPEVCTAKPAGCEVIAACACLQNDPEHLLIRWVGALSEQSHPQRVQPVLHVGHATRCAGHVLVLQALQAAGRRQQAETARRQAASTQAFLGFGKPTQLSRILSCPALPAQPCPALAGHTYLVLPYSPSLPRVVAQLVSQHYGLQ